MAGGVAGTEIPEGTFFLPTDLFIARGAVDGYRGGVVSEQLFDRPRGWLGMSGEIVGVGAGLALFRCAAAVARYWYSDGQVCGVPTA